MADPVQVVANALAWLPVPFDAGLQGVTATKAAEVAVAALKANPEALAALLDSSPHVHRYAVGSSAAEAEPETEWLYEVRT